MFCGMVDKITGIQVTACIPKPKDHMRYNFKEKKVINIHIPTELHDAFAKLCVDYGITKTEAILRYMRYLKAQHISKRRLVDEHSRSHFKLDQRELE
jgi:hypothetical protein